MGKEIDDLWKADVQTLTIALVHSAISGLQYLNIINEVHKLPSAYSTKEKTKA